MKLAEFNALCDREWSKTDRGGRGDVVLLTLTGPGAAELTRDVIAEQEGHRAYLSLAVKHEVMTQAEADRLAVGIGIEQVVNPVTRTVVKIRTKPGGARETARVRVMGGTYRQTWWPAST